MGLFGNRKPEKTRLQVPDELAARANQHYGSQEFEAAFETYIDAVDKLHTMYVVGEQRFRQAGPQDDVLLTGAVNSLGAALAANPKAHLDESVRRASAYLYEIADSLNGDGTAYANTARELEREVRMAR